MKKYLVEVSSFDKISLDILSNSERVIFNSEEEAREEYNQICLDDYRPSANERIEKSISIIEIEEDEIEDLSFPLDISGIFGGNKPDYDIIEEIENEKN